MCFPLQKCSKNPTIDSEPSVSHQFRKRQEWSYPKGQVKVILEKKLFHFVFFSAKLSHYKTYDFKKFLIPDVFKHVRIQNRLNRCEVHQLLPLMVDYACFFVKCINCQNVICIQKIYFLQDFANSCDRAQFLARILQEFCKNAIASKNLARIELFVRFLHNFLNLQESGEMLQEMNFLLTKVGPK